MGVLVPARVHQQNIDGYCGAACAQMALAALGVDPETLAQRDLYAASHDAAAPVFWYSHPHTLTGALNEQWQNADNLRFRLFRCADKGGVNQVMRRTFEQFGQRGAVAIVLTGSSLHWVVVRGFETDPADPSGPSVGFHLRNPAPSIGADTEDWAHAANDGCCTGHGVCGLCHYMSVNIWNDSLRPVSEAGPWKDEYLVICPDSYVPGLCDDELVPASGTEREEPAAPTGPILSTREIAAQVEQLIRDDSFTGVDCIDDATRLTRPATPILVERLNEDGSTDPDGAYYLVPFVDAEGEWGDPDSIPLAMTVNAFTGEFEEVIAVPDGSVYDPAWILPEGIERRARANNLDSLRTRAEPDSEFPYLAVWRPTEQTPTRFWPLFVQDQSAVDDPDRDASPAVFMRVDGQVVTELNDLHP